MPVRNTSTASSPTSKPIRPRLGPAIRHGSEPPLVTITLETEPTAAVFARDLDVASEEALTPLRRTPSVRKASEFVGSWTPSRGSPIHSPPFRGGRRHQPHFPPLAQRVHERPVTQTASLAPIPRPARSPPIWFCRAGARNRLIGYGRRISFVAETYVFAARKVIAYPIFSRYPVDRSSEVR